MQSFTNQLIESQTRRVLLPRITRPGSISQRAIGLLGKPPLKPGEGVWLEPCAGGTHTFGMKYAIDVACFTREGEIVKIWESVAPNRVCLPIPGGHAILEVAGGEAKRCGLMVGMRCLLS